MWIILFDLNRGFKWRIQKNDTIIIVKTSYWAKYSKTKPGDTKGTFKTQKSKGNWQCHAWQKPERQRIDKQVHKTLNMHIFFSTYTVFDSVHI